MSVEDFLGRLKGVTEDGKGGWMACCPAHDDHNPSMHVNVGDDGRILVKCFAGCSSDDIVAAMGIEKKDLMAEKTYGGSRREPPAASDDSVMAPLPVAAAPKKARDRGKLVCEYVYEREDGAAVFKVQRRVMANGKKTFVQMSPDPSAPGGWTWGVAKQGVEYIPYQLPLIRKAAEAGKTVVVAEGEKDVCTIIKRLNLAATCNAKGAGKWSAGWGKYFEGVPRIIIIADKDPDTTVDKKKLEKKVFAVGQRHACDVERKLRADGYTGEIRKVVMPDVEVEQGVTKKVKDFTDWVDSMDLANRTVDRSSFAEAIKESGEWPDRWNFQDDDPVDLQRAQKEARNSASSSDAKGEEEARGGGVEEKRIDGRTQMGEAGRFGRPCPRSPFKERGYFQVDFQMDAGKIARLNVGRDAIQLEGWERSERNDETHGEFYEKASYGEIKCPVSRMVAMVIGCMDSFDKHFRIANPQRTELTCMIALAWLRSRGKFFADIDNPMYSTSLYFDDVEGVLYGIQSNEFQSFLSTSTNVSRENKVFKFMMALIEDMTMDKVTPRIRPSKQWERQGDRIYFSNGDSRMFRVSPGKIDDVANGTDGIVFLRGETLLPFKLLEGPGVDPFSNSMLFKYASLGKPTDVMNCRLWTLNMFYCDQNKPILLFNGPKGSGKTFLAQGIKQFVGVRSVGKLDDTVNQIDRTDKGGEAFWIIEDKGRCEIFDNFDYKIGWADNDMQLASTGGSHKTRELYKTSQLVTLYARAFFMLTSNNAVFASEGGGLPDRIIKIETVGRPKISKGPSELRKDTLEHRDEYMTWFLRTLSKALSDTDPVDSNINRRHPEFAVNAIRCARALGCEKEAIHALSMAEIEKAVLPLMNDVVAREIVAVLLDQEKPGMMNFTSGDMAKTIISRFGDDEANDQTKRRYSSTKIGTAIKKKFKDDFTTIFVCSSRVLHGTELYEFKGLTARGESVIESLKGGRVDFNPSFSESPYEKSENADLCENTCVTSTRPPYARAPIDDISFTRGEESNENVESEDLDDFDF